jgi:toxin secretion/phage lysis holin
MTMVKLLFSNLSSAAIGSTGKEAAAGGAIAFIGTFASSYLGGWDTAIKLLFVLMVADYVTGLLGAIKQKKVDSEVMFWGGVRKGVVLLVISIAALCDSWISAGSPVFRTIAVYFYAGREGLSVVENVGILGVPLPAQLVSFLEQLKQKGESSDGKGL